MIQDRLCCRKDTEVSSVTVPSSIALEVTRAVQKKKDKDSKWGLECEDG